MKTASQSARLEPCVTHPVDPMSPERVLGIVLWTVLFAVLVTMGL